MKHIILALAASIITLGALAQTDKSSMAQSKKKLLNGLVMENGKVMTYKKGRTKTMKKETMLEDGSRVTTDGTIIYKDGSKVFLKEGQHVDMTGKTISNDYKASAWDVPKKSKK